MPRKKKLKPLDIQTTLPETPKVVKEPSIYDLEAIGTNEIEKCAYRHLWSAFLLETLRCACMTEEECSTSADGVDKREARLFFKAPFGPWAEYRNWVFSIALGMDNYKPYLNKIRYLLDNNIVPEELNPNLIKVSRK